MVIWAVAVQAQQPPSSAMDSTALVILDHMAQNIGELHACSFHLITSQDALDHKLDLTVKQLGEHDVYMTGPDRMLVNSNGDKGHRGYWYNGSDMVFYSYSENNYATMPAPDNIIAAIDSLHRTYSIDFPAADFFYPTFVDDLIKQSERIAFVGVSRGAGMDCYHIVATGKDQDVQVWIANDATFLPVMYVYADKAGDRTTELTGRFSDWQINPDLPEAMFNFTPPPGAHQVSILPAITNTAAQ